MRGAKSVSVAAFLFLLTTGCARTAAGPEQETFCPPEVRTARNTPSRDVGPTSQVSLGSLMCSDPETGMSLIEVSVLNPHATRAAWYEVTLQFTTSTPGTAGLRRGAGLPCRLSRRRPCTRARSARKAGLPGPGGGARAPTTVGSRADGRGAAPEAGGLGGSLRRWHPSGCRRLRTCSTGSRADQYGQAQSATSGRSVPCSRIQLWWRMRWSAIAWRSPSARPARPGTRSMTSMTSR